MVSRDFSLAYCTNIWSHHQAPVCTELVRILGEDRFRLCLFEPVYEEQRKLGWNSAPPADKWIAGPPNSSDEMKHLTQIVCDSDVAVLGHCPQAVQAARVATGKLTFIMSERLMRQRFFHLRMLNPRFARGIRSLRSRFNRPNVHYLAIGAHALADAKRLRVFGDQIWNWAYFISPATKPYCERSSSTVRLLWAGRFINLKRVDIILRAMAMLGSSAANCTLDLIGDGPQRNVIKHLAHRLGLDDRINFIDSMPHESVCERMAEAAIYVFPSNHLEGWGAVVGEAMSEGCVVVASNAAGAPKILIEHGRTGFLFADGDLEELTDILRQVIENIDLRSQIGKAAAVHMNRLWHPRVGAERLIALCQGLLGRTPMPVYPKGACCHMAQRLQ